MADRARHHRPSRRPLTKTQTSLPWPCGRCLRIAHMPTEPTTTDMNETRIVLPMSSVRTVTYVPACSMRLSQLEGPLMLARLRTWAQTLRRDVHAIYLAARDPRVPWYAKALALAVAGYALSPIDLIPDFIPVLGYVDDLVIVPLGVWLVVTLVPAEIMVECRAKANAAASRPISRGGMVAIILLWMAGAFVLG